MARPRVSPDLKMAALRMLQAGYRTEDITNFTAISRSTIYRAWRAFRSTGSVSRPPSINRGRPRLAMHQDVQLLLQFARHNPTIFLDEYCAILQGKR
ncbi:hypothetical protein K466DRAFT_451537, partial [Polyporus arcularius HHB13444]